MSASKASIFRQSSYRHYQSAASSRFPGYRQTASGHWVERDEWEPNECLDPQLIPSTDRFC